jgi:hypothetical protein
LRRPHPILFDCIKKVVYQTTSTANTFNDTSGSQSEFKWVIAITAAVKFASIKKRADVVHNNLTTRDKSDLKPTPHVA